MLRKMRVWYHDNAGDELISFELKFGKVKKAQDVK
jgi:hypothetical protein